jgi:hypothetical protein
MFWFFSRQPSEFELKIAYWFFGIAAALTLASYIILSETDVKECKKICKKKGYNYSNYIPSIDDITKPECNCCNKIKTGNGVVIKDCIEVDF